MTDTLFQDIEQLLVTLQQEKGLQAYREQCSVLESNGLVSIDWQDFLNFYELWMIENGRFSDMHLLEEGIVEKWGNR